MMHSRQIRQRLAGGLARRSAPRRRLAGGFTFIEVLVVVIILALIASIVGVQLLGQGERARVDATKIQISQIRSALDLYRLHNSTYPGSSQGLKALLSRPDVGNPPRNWQGPYLSSNQLPKDGWGNDFVYSANGGGYVIRSLGADGTEGGGDLNADISSEDQ